MRLLFALLFAGVAAAAPCGDCDGSGTLDVLDALRAAQLAAGIIPTVLADCPCDVYYPLPACGVTTPLVDVLDAVLIAQSAAGVPVGLSCAP